MNGGVKEMKTKTVKNNPNPAWNETFRFNVSTDVTRTCFYPEFSFQIPDMASKTIILQVYDWDMLSKNDPIGEVHIPLSHFDFSRKITEWKHLQKFTGKVQIWNSLRFKRLIVPNV
jgi:Ca2+-dependent lipid-binding protein